jgi:hypothetical protein
MRALDWISWPTSILSHVDPVLETRLRDASVETGVLPQFTFAGAGSAPASVRR